MKNKVKALYTRMGKIPEIGVLIPLALIMVFTHLVNNNFLTSANMTAMLKSIPFIGLATLGASLCLVTGNVDISVGRVAGLTGMVFGYVMTQTNNLPLAILLGICVGVAIGLLNGFLVVNMGISSFIATMGTLYICGGLRYLVNHGTAMTLPESFRNFSQLTPLGISWFFWIVVGIYIIVGFVQRKTVFGRRLYATTGC